MTLEQVRAPQDLELRVSPIPQGEIEPFTIDEIGIYLRGFGNHEAKALLLLRLAEQDSMLGIGEINEDMIDCQGINPGWEQSAQAPQSYIDRTMAPFVQSKFVSNHYSAAANRYYDRSVFGINDAGMRATAFAASNLDWALESGYSTQTVLGTSHTNNKVNAPLVRFNIIESLLRPEYAADGCTRDEIEADIGTESAGSVKALIEQAQLSDHPIFEYVPTPAAEPIYEINGKIFTPTQNYAKQLTKDFRAEVRRLHEDEDKTSITLSELVAVVCTIDPTLQPDEARKFVVNSNAAFLDRANEIRPKNAPRGKLRIRAEAVEDVKDLVKRVAEFRDGTIPAAQLYEKYRMRGREIANDQGLCKIIMAQAKYYSSEAKVSRQLPVAQYIAQILPPDPSEGMNCVQIMRRIQEDYNQTVSPTTVRAVLAKLVRKAQYGKRDAEVGSNGTRSSQVVFYKIPKAPKRTP